MTCGILYVSQAYKSTRPVKEIAYFLLTSILTTLQPFVGLWQLSQFRILYMVGKAP
jgi:hypothetical protein